MAGNVNANAVPRKRGFPRIAAAMAWDPAFTVFPRFREANALNLLCLQSEVCELELLLKREIRNADNSADATTKSYSINLESLRKDGGQSEQWKLFTELRGRLKEYNEAVLTQIAMNDQVGPSEYDLELLQSWLRSPYGGASAVRGAGSDTWEAVEDGGRSARDLLFLNSKSAGLGSFRRVASKLLPLIEKYIPFVRLKYETLLPEEGDINAGRLLGTSTSVSKFGGHVTTLLAAALILVPVITLHFVTNSNWRLVLIVIFTLAFTMTMSLITEAKRSEIFAAAAAFVAVQVVYVGSVH